MMLRRIIICLSLGIGFLVPPTVQAGNLIPGPDDRGSFSQRQLPCYETNNQQKDCGNLIAGDFAGAFTDQWNKILDLILYVLGGIAVLMLIYAGIQYALASNQPDAAKKARQNIINVATGIILIVASYGIIRLAVAIGKAFLP